MHKAGAHMELKKKGYDGDDLYDLYDLYDRVG